MLLLREVEQVLSQGLNISPGRKIVETIKPGLLISRELNARLGASLEVNVESVEKVNALRRQVIDSNYCLPSSPSEQIREDEFLNQISQGIGMIAMGIHHRLNAFHIIHCDHASKGIGCQLLHEGQSQGSRVFHQ